MPQYQQIEQLTQPYDLLLLDLWGVIHDGQTLYPGVKDTLKHLRDQGKRMIFISNAPRRSSVAQAKLDALGIDRNWYDAIVTSGEVTRTLLTQQPDALPFPITHNYAIISPERDAELLDNTDFTIVNDWSQASFILNLGFDDDDLEIENYQHLLERGMEHKLPMICANPDDIIVRLDGSPFPCAGLLAERYQTMGGTVTYIGKPYADIYIHAMQLTNISKERTIAIGDNIHTDIAGAVRTSIDSALITGGVLSFKTNSSTSMSQVIAAETAKHNAVPTYVAKAFRLNMNAQAA